MEYLLMEEAKSDELVNIVSKVISGQEITSIEQARYAIYLAAWARLTEETYLQYLEDQISEGYWLSRANNMVHGRLQTPISREYIRRWMNNGYMASEFSIWLEDELNREYGE